MIGYGSGVGKAVEVADQLAAKGHEAGIVDLRFAKPLDEDLLVSLAETYTQWYIISDSAKIGGVGSLLLALKEQKNLHVKIKTFEFDDAFITHGATHLIEERLGITSEQIAEKIVQEIV